MTVPSKRQKLAEELVRVRVRAGMTGRDMARALRGPSGKALSQAQLYRYDKAVTTPSIPTVRAWLDACASADAHAVTAEDRARILELAETAHAEPKNWKDYRDVGATTAQDAAAQQDEDAVEEWSAQNVILPGLVQTPEYAMAAVARADLYGQFNHPDQVAKRLARQRFLFEPGRRWHFVIAEHLLSESPGSVALLAPQRDRLLTLAATDGVEVAVLPRGAVLEPSGLWWNPFTIIRPREGERYVVVEDVAGERPVKDSGEIASYELTWDRLWSAAVSGAEAVEFIRSLS